MKRNNIIWIYSLLVFGFTFLLTNGCQKDEPKITKEKVTGSVQKGPFVNGTSILMSELNASLQQTGNSFTTQILNNAGSFEINNISLTSSYVEFLASGYYFDEVKGDKSVAPLNLYALSDITDISTVNVNILTHLEKQRVETLVKQNKTFSEAKKTAQAEIMAIFGISLSEMNISETLDISVNNESNAILLAISLILQGNRSVGDLTELMANISNDIREDGILNSESIKTNLRNSTKELVLSTIRTNLEKRYQELGISASIPGFEKYVNVFLAFTGQKPSATVPTATNIETTSVILNEIVNPNSLSTIVTFQYGTAIIYGDSAIALQSPVTGSLPVTVSANVTGLSPGIVYHFRVKTENALGIIYSEDQTFTTLGQAPNVTLLPTTYLTNTSARLNGNVNANYLSTMVTFEWGTTINYGYLVPATQSPLSGNILENVSADLSGLTLGITYHCRIKVENVLGTAYTDDLAFTTTMDGQVGIVVDIEGNIYKTIGIGHQIWMAEHLRTTMYSNGDLVGTTIPATLDISNDIQPKYQWACQGNKNIVAIYGRQYTWYAVTDSRNVCPAGWHVPADEEWTVLTDFLGGEDVAGGKLKEAGLAHWYDPNTDANNETGFTSIPGGYRGSSGEFYEFGVYDHIWTSSDVITDQAVYRVMYSTDGYVHRDTHFKYLGFSVRCLKD